ncbi:uncharacterized protein LOC143361353 [Halictus rubicundus]|uniref:uncharacterized protein LOC143361353 n=1 Tax=Halictus rubicundus TaxID=77578 RepID=UPI0040359FB0
MAVLASGGHKDELRGLDEVRKAVEHAETRARSEQKRNHAKNGRELAKALHREADQLYRSGDYESALVVYHRAANLFPRDDSHRVAAMRTTATINSCNNPPRTTRRTSSANIKTEERLMASLCPETAAILANEKLKSKPDVSSVTEVLSYFDDHKSFWKTVPSPRPMHTQLARSKLMLRQLNNLADEYLAGLEASFNSGKMADSMRTAQGLLMVSENLEDSSRYQIASYHYLSLIHVALKRHDWAVCSVSRLIRLSKSTGDVVQLCRALATLGKVHLSFGHLNAAARAWEHLAADLKEPIPLAWIRHEIGRCYLETGKYLRALEMAFKCIEVAEEVNSTKWLLHGKLLLGQSLAKIGRFAEATRELYEAAKITEEEGDTPMHSYIQDLIDRMSLAVRRLALEKVHSKESKVASPRSKNDERPFEQSNRFCSRTQTIITTMFSQKRVITEYRDGGSSSESEDEEITANSDGSLLQSYLCSSARSDLGDDNVTSRGDTTFRVNETEGTSKELYSSPSEFSSSSDQERTGKPGNLEQNNEENLTEDNADEEAAMLKNTASETSLKTVDTTATYVIESQDDDSLSGTMKLDGCGKTLVRDRKLTGTQMIEELARQDLGLLEIARDLLLMSKDDRSPDSGDAEDFGISRPVDRH